MSLNADDVTLNNNVIPPNNNLNVAPDTEADVQSHRTQNAYLSAANGPRSVPENISDVEHTRSIPLSTDQTRKNLPNEDNENLSSSVKETDAGLPAGATLVKPPLRPESKPPSNATGIAVTSNKAVIKLWVVVVITLIHCVVLMIAEHLTHSLTLRVEAYHSLYNVGVLVGSLLSIKLCQQPESLQNTFGWARIDVVLYLVSLIFLSSLCFSVAVEAAQTALHIHHQDPMHHPVAIIFVCCGSLAVNAIVFFLIGGYTQHQGSFCDLRGSGEVFIKKQVKEDSLQRGQRTLSSRNQKTTSATSGRPHRATQRQGYRDVLRDITGILLAMVCAVVLAVFSDPDSLVAYYLDSVLAVFSVTLLMWLSYPFGKECSNILLQTIPDHIDVSKFSETLQQSFPDVLNVHHLHIWSLRPGQVVATVHMIFADKGVYQKNSDALTKFFQEQQISQVTLQPEFIVAEMATLPYCRCVDHLLDEAEDICDDFAMSHLDIHYHLHGNHLHHHHEEYHHHHHHHDDLEHEHHHNHNHEHVYYNENLHHEIDRDHTDRGHEHICDGVENQHHHVHPHQRHVHIHDNDKENNDLRDENETTSDLPRNKMECEDQREVCLHHKLDQDHLPDGGSCHTSTARPKSGDDHPAHDVIYVSKSHNAAVDVVANNQSGSESVHGPSTSEIGESEIESVRENNVSILDEAGGKGGRSKASNLSSRCKIIEVKIANDEREGNDEKNVLDSSTEFQDKEINAKCNPRTELCVKPSLSPEALSHEKTSKTSISNGECEINSNSVDRQETSPQTSCSELDNEEDLSYSYHKTSSEKRNGFEDGDRLLSCDHPTTKEEDNDKPVPQSAEISRNSVNDDKL